MGAVAAAFGRLCVETYGCRRLCLYLLQPPSGGCVLKPPVCEQRTHHHRWQPPSGGCVLKLFEIGHFVSHLVQPPSGGCVLKQYGLIGHSLVR